MRILHISPLYPPHVGGLETHAEQFNRHLIALHSAGKTPGVKGKTPGVEEALRITVFTPHLPSDSLSTEIISPHLTIIRFPAWQIIPNYPLPKFWQPRFWQLWHQLNDTKFDVVISRTRFFYTCLMAVRFARRHTIPYLHIEHGSDYVSLNNPLTGLLAKLYDHTLGRYVLKGANKLVANSEATATFVKQLSGRNAQVIYRGVDTDLITNTPPNLKIRSKFPNRTIVTYAGRLIDGKGVDDLIMAYSKITSGWLAQGVPRRAPAAEARTSGGGKGETGLPAEALAKAGPATTQTHLLIIGSGPQAQNLKQLAKQLHLTDHITFLGQQSLEQTISILKSSDIFVNPSHNEGLPSSVIEAALCKTAIIATNVGGTPEIVTNHTSAILIPPHQPKILADKLSLLISNPAQRHQLGNQAYSEVFNKFTWPRAITAYHHLLENLIIKNP